MGSVLAEPHECFADADMVPDILLYFECITKFHNLVSCLDCKYLALWKMKKSMTNMKLQYVEL